MNVEVKKNRRTTWLSSLAVGLTIGLAGLVMVACQPADQTAANQPAANQPDASQGSGGGQRPNFQMAPAPELPTTQPVARGVVVSRDGNTLTVQEINPNFRAGGNGGTPRPTPDGTPRPRPTFAGGPQIQVDVSGAQFYQDVTFASLNGQRPSGSIQQKVEAGNVDGISANSRVTIWGDQNGNQIAAKVVVYSQPRSPQQQ